MFSGGKGAAPKPGASAAAGGSPPEISREEPEGFLNLRDPWARVYLARGCAAVIQSGHIAGRRGCILTEKGRAIRGPLVSRHIHNTCIINMYLL